MDVQKGLILNDSSFAPFTLGHKENIEPADFLKKPAALQASSNTTPPFPEMWPAHKRNLIVIDLQSKGWESATQVSIYLST